MSLIIVSGSNIGDSESTLLAAQTLLSQKLELVAASRIYRSPAVDYEAQPDFMNQALEFKLPALSPREVMNFLLETEKSLGRVRDIPKGPRTLDLDIIFWGLETVNEAGLEIPHPRWRERSFVVLPIRELPFFQTIEKWFTIPPSFKVTATPL